MQSVFTVIAEPSRRAILGLLASSERTVGELGRRLRMPQPTVSKHLRVLREAGFVESTVDAQRRLYRLRPEPLQEVEAWLAPFRRYWSAHVDALERHLDRLEGTAPTRRKPGREERPATRSPLGGGGGSGRGGRDRKPARDRASRRRPPRRKGAGGKQNDR